MICELPADAVRQRVNQVCRMLQPLRGSNAARIACRSESGGDCITLTTFSGLQPVTPLVAQWRFTTYVPSLLGEYYERWRPVDEKRKRYFLDRAYLHLYMTTRVDGQPTEKQMLALHCDPNEPDEPDNWAGPVHARYKRGPHLHISVAEHPIPHSHIALNACHLDSVLHSVESLSEAMQRAVQMLDHQVLKLL